MVRGRAKESPAPPLRTFVLDATGPRRARGWPVLGRRHLVGVEEVDTGSGPLQGDSSRMPRDTLLGTECYKVMRLPDRSKGTLSLPARPWDHCPRSLVGECSRVEGRHPTRDFVQGTCSLNLSFFVPAPLLLSSQPQVLHGLPPSRGCPLRKSWLSSPQLRVSGTQASPLLACLLICKRGSISSHGFLEAPRPVLSREQVPIRACLLPSPEKSRPQHRGKVPLPAPLFPLVPEMCPQPSRRRVFVVPYFGETVLVLMGTHRGSFQKVRECCHWSGGSSCLSGCLGPQLLP